MNKTPLPDASNVLHKFMAAGSGAAGGFLGFPALPFELPISTTIMLRSIADIARSEGFYLTEPRIKVGCMEVFALGGPGSADDAVDAGYLQSAPDWPELSMRLPGILCKKD